MLDNDEKIDLELILALIRHIVLKDEVSLTLNVQGSCLKVAKFRFLCHFNEVHLDLGKWDSREHVLWV